MLVEVEEARRRNARRGYGELVGGYYMGVRSLAGRLVGGYMGVESYGGQGWKGWSEATVVVRTVVVSWAVGRKLLLYAPQRTVIGQKNQLVLTSRSRGDDDVL